MTARIRVRMVTNGHAKTCPTCGQTLPEPKPFGIHLSPLRTRLFEIVRRAGENGISTDKIVELLYARHPDGGPLTAVICVRTLICQINKRIRPHGFEIKGRHWGRISRGDYGSGEYVYQRISS